MFLQAVSLMVRIACFVLFIGVILPHQAYAIVGEAERFDEFAEADLNEFQEKLTTEEKLSQMDLSTDYIQILTEKEAQLEKEQNADIRKILEEDIESLKSQLLQIPNRDRFQAEISGDYTYDSNISRQVPRQEKGDSVFNAATTAVFDLSGKKTDLRFDLGMKRQWNWVFSEKDSWQVEERLRFRRKYFTRLNTSTNSRIARNNSKTIEIDDNKIRWDASNQIAFNFPFSRKLAFSTTLSSSKRYFPQEAFDQDSGWQVGASPSAFWNITPKSRVSLGYSFGASRSRVKSGDSNSHAIDLAYFGKITRKSSASLTLSYNKQVPRSLDTAKARGVTAGIGTIWQITPKTQVTVQYIRAFQNTSSDLIGGEVDGSSIVSKTDTHFVNENLSVSFNSRLMKKVTAVITTAIAHTQTKTFVDGNKDVETRQFSFPLSASLGVALFKWANWNLGYTFNFRTGNEKPDTTRAHTWTSSLRLVF